MTRKQPDPVLQKLLRALPPLHDLLRGSLLERHTFHPSSVSCATCASGQGHLQRVLTVIYPGGKTRQLSLHPKQVPQVRRQIANLARVRAILERICQINQNLLPAQRDQLRKERS